MLIEGTAKQGVQGTFYLEWRENGKRIKKPLPSTPR